MDYNMMSDGSTLCGLLFSRLLFDKACFIYSQVCILLQLWLSACALIRICLFLYFALVRGELIFCAYVKIKAAYLEFFLALTAIHL